MKLFIDDIRNAPDDTWMTVRTITEAIRIISRYDVREISLDHDISHHVTMGRNGRPFPCPETFMAVAYFICEKYWQTKAVNDSDAEMTSLSFAPEITIHTANPVAAEEMGAVFSEFGIEYKVKAYGPANRLEMEA